MDGGRDPSLQARDCLAVRRETRSVQGNLAFLEVAGLTVQRVSDKDLPQKTSPFLLIFVASISLFLILTCAHSIIIRKVYFRSIIIR